MARAALRYVTYGQPRSWLIVSTARMRQAVALWRPLTGLILDSPQRECDASAPSATEHYKRRSERIDPVEKRENGANDRQDNVRSAFSVARHRLASSSASYCAIHASTSRRRARRTHRTSPGR